ncbi:hypothetical protein HK105_208907 [Polyrhizophydium stewartii]|uniref:Tetratricopeptide repeat protein n=1 Tax=Polyrhizophydium stewartii TaxID=2732419 RepID=A0ABR4MWM2_9FUNG
MNDFSDYESFRPNMTREEVLVWFQRRLNRPPEAFDIYQVTLPGAALPGRHLLGYCYLNLGESERALREFKKCVKEGYHDDWQLVIELTVEIEAKRRQEALNA